MSEVECFQICVSILEKNPKYYNSDLLQIWHHGFIHFRVNSLLSLNAATLVIIVQFMFLHLSRMKWIICLLQLEDGFFITSEGWIIYVTEMFEQIKIWCYCKIWDFLGLQIIFICNICICFNVKIYICIKPV